MQSGRTNTTEGGIRNDSLVISGVSQKIILVPLFFTLLIVDIADTVSSNITSFSDEPIEQLDLVVVVVVVQQHNNLYLLK